MDDLKLADLKFKAEAASPGPWVCDSLNNISNGIWFVVYTTKAPSGSVPTAEDAAFITAASPGTVRELVLDVQRARAERDWLAQHLAGACDFRRAEECPVSCGVADHCPRNSGKCRCLDATKEDWLECAQEATSQTHE